MCFDWASGWLSEAETKAGTGGSVELSPKVGWKEIREGGSSGREGTVIVTKSSVGRHRR